jgi:hypothetical protein
MELYKKKEGGARKSEEASQLIKDYLEREGFHPTILQTPRSDMDWGLVRDWDVRVGGRKLQDHVKSFNHGELIEAETELHRLELNHIFTGPIWPPLRLLPLIESFGYVCKFEPVPKRGAKLLCKFVGEDLKR